MDVKYRADKIEPYDKCFFINCFYHSLIPILRIEKYPFLDLMSNFRFTYTDQKDEINSGGNLIRRETLSDIIDRSELEIKAIESNNFFENNLPRVECKDIALLKAMRSDIQIKTSKRQRIQYDVIDYIYNQIPAGSVFIIWVDAYYIPTRRDTYKKKHLAHSILIYGFNLNDHELEFITIDHTIADSFDYKKNIRISSDILKAAYIGFCKHYNSEINIITLYEVLLRNELMQKRSSSKNCSPKIVNELYMNNLMKIQHNILRYLNWEKPIDSLNSYFIITFNNIITNKRIENACINAINDINIENRKIVPSLWEELRAIFVKSYFTEKPIHEWDQKIRILLKNILTLEKNIMGGVYESN